MVEGVEAEHKIPLLIVGGPLACLDQGGTLLRPERNMYQRWQTKKINVPPDRTRISVVRSLILIRGTPNADRRRRHHTSIAHRTCTWNHEVRVSAFPPRCCWTRPIVATIVQPVGFSVYQYTLRSTASQSSVAVSVLLILLSLYYCCIQRQYKYSTIIILNSVVLAPAVGVRLGEDPSTFAISSTLTP